MEAIQRLQPRPLHWKDVEVFVGMVNFLSMFCPELQHYWNPYMTWQGKADHLYEEKNNKISLKRLSTG